MNGVRSIIRSSRKVNDLIKYCLAYHDLRYLRKIKHTGSNKLIIFMNVHDQIVVHYTVPLFSFEKVKTYVPVGSFRKVIIDDQQFDVHTYDKSELFNLSTIHDNNLLQWLQVFCGAVQCRVRNVQVYRSITQDLLYEAHSAFSTQYEKIDEEKYAIYRGR